MIEQDPECRLHSARCTVGSSIAGGDARPYPFQQRLADEGLPELLRVPTGSGKTLAATLPWLFRRWFAGERVRAGTPRRLVIVLPQRSLVEQTAGVISCWLRNLGLRRPENPAGVRLDVLMGGASTDEREWLKHPEEDAILVGTQDMVVSRLLLRGYAEPPSRRPMSFGLLHASTQFVFDEVQLMGPALPTSLQLQGLREAIGAAVGSRSMWMSATVDPARLRTADYAGPTSVIELSNADREDPRLRARLTATRTVRKVETPTDAKKYAAGVAAALLDHHSPGTRTIAVLNTVGRATEVSEALAKAKAEAKIVLLHSRFRPGDRAAQMNRALAAPGETGTIVVATQVIEAGVDLTSRVLFTEAAPWSSIVQRAGRCNREGEVSDAVLLWSTPPAGRDSAAPYNQSDVDNSAAELRALDEVAVTGTDLQGRPVAEVEVQHSVLRRRDLFDLFDTAPDMSGNDIDVTRWVRDAQAVTVGVAWRDVPPGGPARDDPRPDRAELCQAPVAQVRAWIEDGRAWVIDASDGAWRLASGQDVRPGGVLVVEAGRGGYLPEKGWTPKSRTAVAPVTGAAPERPDGMPSDRGSEAGRWVTLTEHLDDVDREVGALLDRYAGTPGLTDDHRAAARIAGRYHDLGKAHETFARSLEDVARRSGLDGAPNGGPWAKSGSRETLRHHPPYFRHELVSALMLLSPKCDLLDGVAEADLITYLVAAHHGKVRLTVRAAADEKGDHVLGVASTGESLPLTLPDGRKLPTLPLDRSVLALGGTTADSWQARACALRDRLGPFRLAFLEAVVRAADWRASARYDKEAVA